MRCSRCGSDNPVNARFCNQCGSPFYAGLRPVALPDKAPVQYTPRHLAERILADQDTLGCRGGGIGERKIITALFADIAGSTALIHGLDPEEGRQLIDPVLGLMMEAVHHYEGYVAKSLGDGILALFGAPIVHEDHPQRALYAALRMLDTMCRYEDLLRRQKGIGLQIRVGIDTGEVVVRPIRTEDLHTDYDPVGPTIHIASRMEGIAPPGTIIVSETTRRLSEGYFDFRALEGTKVKGVPEPMAVYEVLGLGPLRTRLQVASPHGLAPYIGRHSELKLLHQAFAQASNGRGQIVGVGGESGVGKSRLFYEFKRQLPKHCQVLETLSVSHGKAFPYRVLISLLKSYLQIRPEDDKRSQRNKALSNVLALSPDLEKWLPYLHYLLGISETESSLVQMDQLLRRQRTFESIAQLLVCESQVRPLVLIVEDLQWMDRDTHDFLEFFADLVPDKKILMLVNYRPEYQQKWLHQYGFTAVILGSLRHHEAEELLSTLLGNDPTLEPLKQLALNLAEGIPFFLEEVVQTLIEEQLLSGVKGAYRLKQLPDELQIPTTVKGILSARIDRLPVGDKALLQTLAVIGKDFPWSLVKLVVDCRDEAELHRGLAKLRDAEFIYALPAFPEVEYSFKHGLTQQVAYESLSMSRRSVIHERTAQAIEVLFSDQLEDHYNELAHHYSHSDNDGKAVTYLHHAGEQAARRAANQEAIEHLTKALEFLERLPDSTDRAQQELSIKLSLGPPLMATKGYTSPDVETTYSCVLQLCRRLGDNPLIAPALVGLRRFYTLRANYRMAQQLAKQLEGLAQRIEDPELLLEANLALGTSLFFQGDLGQAQLHFEQVILNYDPERYRPHAFLNGMNPGVSGLTLSSWVLCYRGYLERALRRSEEAISMAESLDHPFSLAFALCYGAELHLFRGERAQAREKAEAAIALSIEQGFPYWQAWASILHGYILAKQGQNDAGIAEIRSGILNYRATGAELCVSHFQLLLVELLGQSGQTEESEIILAEALSRIEKYHEGLYEAESHRLKGNLILQLAGGERSDARVNEAERCFDKALSIASRQGARSLEMRAALDLIRLRHE